MTVVAPPRPRRDLSLLAAGIAVSSAGDAAALTALSVHLRADGPLWVSALLGAELVPVVVLAPLAGRLVDRFENRGLLVGGLIGQAVIAVPLAAAATPWAIVVLFAALNAFATVVRPATSSLVPAITGPDGAPQGYARVALGSGVGYIVGPAAGGIVTGTFGTRAALVADALTFIVLAAAGTGLRTRRDPRRLALRPSPPGAGATAGAGGDGRTGGFRLIARDRVLRIALPVAAVAVGCAVVDNVAAPFRFIDQLGTGSAGYGAYAALWGLGGLVGSQLTPRLTRRVSAESALAAGNVICGLAILGIGVAPGPAVAFAASAAGGVGNGFANVAVNALVVARTPAAAHGRAFSAVGALIQVAVGAGTAAGAPLVAALGAGGAMAVAGALCAVLAAPHLGYALRRAGEPAPSPPGAERAGRRAPR